MRVIVLCAAMFAGGLLAGAVFWPASASMARRATTEGGRDLPEVARGHALGGGDAPGAATGAREAARAPETPLRQLAGEAARELARELDRPAARALLAGDGMIAGNVRDSLGQPVAGAIVTAVPEAQPFDLAVNWRRARERAHEDMDVGRVARDAIEAELWRREVRRTGRTDTEGRYEIKGLPEGWHRVTAFAEEFDIRPTSQNGRVQPDAALDFLAQPVRGVAVEVRLPDGTLADHAWVSWQGAQGSGSDAWQPDPGTVRLPTATCKVKAQTSVPEPLQSAETEYDAGIVSGPLVLKLEGRRMLAVHLVPATGLTVPDGVEFKLRRLEGQAAVDPASLQGDQARSGKQSQGRAAWYDLEPGRYLVAAFLGGRHLVAHGVAEMGEGSSDIGIPFEEPPAGTFVAAKVLAPEGTPAQGSTRFTMILGTGQRARSLGADALRRVDGTWLVLLPEPREEAEGMLRVAVSAYGTAQEPFDPRQPAALTFRFRVPSRLRVFVDRFPGSGVEGRLFAALYGDEGTVSTRQVEADGRCDLGDVQPKDYSLLLFVRDRDSRWTILTRKIALRGGEEEEKVAVPALHTLRVRPAPQLRAAEVTLQSTDPAIGWVRRTARVEGEVATFDALAAAAYEIRCGNKRVEARVPGPDEVRVE
jgi:hypothetical protein